jgi:hypothetical protein
MKRKLGVTGATSTVPDAVLENLPDKDSDEVKALRKKAIEEAKTVQPLTHRALDSTKAMLEDIRLVHMDMPHTGAAVVQLSSAFTVHPSTMGPSLRVIRVFTDEPAAVARRRGKSALQFARMQAAAMTKSGKSCIPFAVVETGVPHCIPYNSNCRDVGWADDDSEIQYMRSVAAAGVEANRSVHMATADGVEAFLEAGGPSANAFTARQHIVDTMQKVQSALKGNLKKAQVAYEVLYAAIPDMERARVLPLEEAQVSLPDESGLVGALSVHPDLVSAQQQAAVVSYGQDLLPRAEAEEFLRGVEPWFVVMPQDGLTLGDEEGNKKAVVHWQKYSPNRETTSVRMYEWVPVWANVYIPQALEDTSTAGQMAVKSLAGMRANTALVKAKWGEKRQYSNHQGVFTNDDEASHDEVQCVRTLMQEGLVGLVD